MSQRKISIQSKSFATLTVLALVGVYLSLFLLHYIYNDNSYTQTLTPQTISHPAATPALPTPTTLDTTTWKQYTNSKYQISFLYPPTWNVLDPIKKNGFEIIQIDPGKKYYNIDIYISPTTYNAVDGLPNTTETINGVSFTNISDLLFAAKPKELYYTFDLGSSLSLKPQFDGLINTVEFK